MSEREYKIEKKLHVPPICSVTANFCEIFENMGEGISIFEIVCDEEEKIVDLRVNYINPSSIINRLKFREEVIDKTITELFNAEKVELYLKMANEAISTGKETRYETYFAQLNKHFLINAFSLRENLYVTMDMDISKEKEAHDKLELKIWKRTRKLEESNEQLKQEITERKKAEKALIESEENFRKLFNKALDMISLVELSEDGMFGKLIEVNEAAINIFGYSKEELLNIRPMNLLAPESRAEIPQIALFQKNGYATVEGICITKDGRKFPVESNIHIFKLGGKNVSLAMARDITERKKAEKQLKETVEELKRSNEELQQFAHVSSHDLQEPLRTIASFTQLLKRRYEGKLDEDADEFIGYIVKASIHMKAQIEALLEYSRVTTKGENFELVDTNLILNQTILNLNASIEASNAEITYDELPSVMGDAGQLGRVFQNLISNAIKFRKYEEPLKIHISADKAENEYFFGIQDNGIGIEKQYFEHIFTIFQRLHTKEEYQSTGIGLSIVKRIIERHGGRVWVESSFGVGSVFYFTIPI